MDTKIVEDIMVPLSQYPCIKHKKTLAEAIAILARSHIEFGGRTSQPRELLVFDDLNILVGLLRRRDIIRGLEPDFIAVKRETAQQSPFEIMKDPLLLELSFDRSTKGLNQRSQRRVYEVMRPIEATITADTHIVTAMAEVIENDVSFIPVLKGEEIVGVVRSIELLSEITRWLKIKT